KLQHALLASYGTHVEPPALLTFEAQIPAATLRAPDPLMVHLGAEDDPVGHEVRGSVLNTLQPKSMVKYRRGHGWNFLRIVRLASNKTEPCHVLFYFSTIRVRVCRKTQMYMGMSEMVTFVFS